METNCNIAPISSFLLCGARALLEVEWFLFQNNHVAIMPMDRKIKCENFVKKYLPPYLSSLIISGRITGSCYRTEMVLRNKKTDHHLTRKNFIFWK